jgi:hypothetical protein
MLQHTVGMPRPPRCCRPLMPGTWQQTQAAEACEALQDQHSTTSSEGLMLHAEATRRMPKHSKPSTTPCPQVYCMQV